MKKKERLQVSRKGSTIDEKILIHLFEIAMKKGDSESEVEIAEILKSTGIKEHATRTSIKLLAQANFVKKVGQNAIKLTQHGQDLVSGSFKSDYSSGLIRGKKMTSLMEEALVKSITMRSIPRPTPPVGGSPWHIASMNSSSSGEASSFLSIFA